MSSNTEVGSIDADSTCCFNCVHWDPQEHGTGHCRRYAPRSQQLASAGPFADRVIWPRTNDADWCGEFEER